ncbi:MAG: hemolysin family protein [Bacteroidota bacterium]
MAEVFGNIVFILILVFFNGFFVAAEFAIVKVRGSQLEELKNQGHKKAAVTKHIVEHLNVYLSSTQLGITLTSLGLGWVGEPLLAEMFRSPLMAIGIMNERIISIVCFAIGFGILTFLHIILGELTPKAIAIKYPEGTSLFVSLPLQLFYRIFRPIIWVIDTSSDILLKKLGIPLSKTNERLHTSEELEIIVNEGAKSGALDKTEQELITSIFEFSNTTAREIMIPRPDMVALNINTPRENLVRVLTEQGYSRMPVYKDSLDNIIGIIYTKDLITLLEHRDVIILQDVIRQAYFVPETVKISQLMRDLQQKKLHMAIVVDEFGGTQGLVTMEDILEEIVGEIHDEYDEILKEVEQSADGSSLVDAKIDIKNFNEKFNADIPDDDPEYETLNGFLIKLIGKIPEIKEEINYGNWQFTVMKKTLRRVGQVKVKKVVRDNPSRVLPSIN